jgi:hypothetical protein
MVNGWEREAQMVGSMCEDLKGFGVLRGQVTKAKSLLKPEVLKLRFM